MSASTYAIAPADKLNAIIGLAEARISAQLTSAIAADQRAMTFSGLLVASAAAMIAILVAMSEGKLPSMLGPVVVMLFGLTFAASFSIASAYPVDWELIGNEPRNWLEDIVDGDSLHNGKAAMADFYDEMIALNQEAMNLAARRMRSSLTTTAATMVLSAAWVALEAGLRLL